MEQLVSAINQDIKNRIGGAGCKIEMMGIAETAILRDNAQDRMIPALIRPDGQAKPTFYDDRLDITIYHRIISKTYETQRNAGYGDGTETVETYEMALIACGKRTRMNPHTLERICSRTIAELQATGYKLNPIRSDFNRVQVWNQEYGGLPFPLELPIFLFKTTYRVQRKMTPCN